MRNVYLALFFAAAAAPARAEPGRYEALRALVEEFPEEHPNADPEYWSLVSYGFPTRCESGGPWPLEGQVRAVLSVLLLAGAGLAWWVDPRFLAVTGRCGMACVLLKMPWNRRPSAR